MSKSLKRVRAALDAAGLESEIRETALARTAADAARALDVGVDQIAKSIVFQGVESQRVVLFLTAGGNRVDADKAAQLAGEPLGKASAAEVRSQTGFAIGGVSPIGHLTPIQAFMDETLMQFGTLWAAAGTPHHVFSIEPSELARIAQAKLADFV